MNSATAEALASEAKDGLIAGAEVQILIEGYATWLAITELWNHGELLHVKLTDDSRILIGKSAIIGVRFGEVSTEE